ncbi:MAG: ComEA family DNA-binding protein [Chloroflexi bacterium]|nr:ComEA family DNA-binding protein [Chloroflexota bacterium]
MSQSGSHQKWWLLALGVLMVALVAGGAVLAYKHSSRPKPLEIEVSSSPPASPVDIYLSGALASEGIYAFSLDTTLEAVLERAGGLTDAGEPIGLKLYVLHAGEDPFGPADVGKRVNVNTATMEELETLNGIGPVKAQAIVDYRNEHVLFRTVDELLNVPGIGPQTLEEIRDQISLVD